MQQARRLKAQVTAVTDGQSRTHLKTVGFVGGASCHQERLAGSGRSQR